MKTAEEKKEKVGTDLKEFVERTINDSAKNHLEAWKSRYAKYKRVSEVRFDLNVNHDSSLEIEYAEGENGVNRELNSKEEEFLIKKFNIAVCKECKSYLNKDY